MRSTKLYNALIQLDGYEFNRLHRFLLSPYFNRSESIVLLFEWIKNDLKDSDKAELSKEEIWQKIITPPEPFDDGRFRKLQSDLLKLVEEYYAQETFEANPIHKAKYLLEAILERRLDKLESSAIKTVQNLSENQKLKPASYYFYQYEIEQSKYDLSKYPIGRSSKFNIEDIAINLDRFYLAEKLRYYCTILSHQRKVALDYNMLFINEIIQHVEEQGYQDVPPIRMYYQILQTYKFPENRIHYDNLRILITKYIHYFPESQVKEILDATFNYCVLKSNSGFPEFVRELFNLYIESLENKSILVKGQITPWSFKNIVTAGLRLKEFDWVEKFISNYGFFLEPNLRKNATTFSMAQFYFYKKDYNNVIGLLSKVEYNDLTYNLDSKTLLMASYYELDAIEALGSFLETFRVYLSRNKELTTLSRKHYLNTINIVRKLAKISPKDKKEIEKLQAEVLNTQGVVSKNWILEKLALLNK
ncbi:MAG: hypothetical protein ABJB16_07100 [Saprospiraceae bacterium]